MGNQKGIAGRAGVATAAAMSADPDARMTAPDPGLPPAPRARVRDELTTLEYPRHLHKKDGAYLRVENESEARIEVANGWCVDANEANAFTPPDPDLE